MEQPKPELPKDYGTLDVEGSIRFRVQFLANGQIGEISPVSSFIKRLDENALEAVKKIIFEPEIKNGETINKVKIFSYDYSWNGGWKIPSPIIVHTKYDEKAEAIIKKAVENLGGEKYLNAKSQIGRGKFSSLSAGTIASFQNFIDVIVFPDKERTEFKSGGSKTVQTNFGKNGWIFDGDALTIKDQTEEQINNFKRGVRTGLDNLLRGNWRKEGTKLDYVGRRQASLGKRNDVVKLTFDDDFTVEFEFSDEGVPMKSIYKRTNADNEEIKEEDRYAQFVDIGGIKTPFIIDHYSNDAHTSRINFESVEFNKPVSDSIFTKPSNVKDLKKDLKL
ncbi:MAG: energy transducer TonB [Acidobacteriota bacterium]